MSMFEPQVISFSGRVFLAVWAVTSWEGVHWLARNWRTLPKLRVKFRMPVTVSWKAPKVTQDE